MKIHFIGIEGIGVSALVGYYLAKLNRQKSLRLKFRLILRH